MFGLSKVLGFLGGDGSVSNEGFEIMQRYEIKIRTVSHLDFLKVKISSGPFGIFVRGNVDW